MKIPNNFKSDNIVIRSKNEIYRLSSKQIYMMYYLLYETDQYIYPYWRDSAAEFARYIQKWMIKPGFIFCKSNFYVALNEGMVAGIVVIVNNKNIHSGRDELLSFNLEDFREEADPRTQVICDKYLKRIYDDCQPLPDDVAFIPALCVKSGYRNLGVGTKMLKACLEDLKESGFKTVYLDCLKENMAARKLYESQGFELVNEGIGFDGTDHSQVEICTYAIYGL